ncbi:MAG: DUF72 domain-containing protein [Myxococcales bacterium]|nr:DUF72 domain-containing protein [Myxococcales bacterium]
MRRDDRQLDLFATPPPAPPPMDARERLEALAASMPPHLRFGTSSWTFPGWAGIVYEQRYASQQKFTRQSLAEYARHPLFRTVGIDRSYYAPLTEEELTHYATQLPEDFPCVSKVWSELSTLVFPKHARYGPLAGKENPRFLDVEEVSEEVLNPFERAFGGHTGPFLVEVAPPGKHVDVAAFEAAVERFLSNVRSGPRFSFELRDRRLLTSRYLAILREHGAAHTINLWTRMPGIAEQLAIDGVLTADFLVVRLMIPPGRTYEDERTRFDPFDRIVEPQPQVRTEVADLVRRTGELSRETFVLVNNKVEGSSPLTVHALAKQIATH